MEEILPLSLSSLNRSIVDRETGPDTKILLTGYADLAVIEPPRSDAFTMKGYGLVLFVKDRRRRNFFIQVIDFTKAKKVLDLKVWSALNYERNPQHPTAHTIFEEGNCNFPTTGLIFKDQIKADLFFKNVTERIMSLRMKRDARASQPSKPPTALAHPPVPSRDLVSPTQHETSMTVMRKKSDPSTEKKSSSSQSKLEKIPNQSPPKLDELLPDEGTSGGIFKRTPKPRKKQPIKGSTARPRPNPNVPSVPRPQLPSRGSKTPTAPKPLPDLPQRKPITSPSPPLSRANRPNQLPVSSNFSSLPLKPDLMSNSPPVSKLPKPAVDRERKPSIPHGLRKPQLTPPGQGNALHVLELKERNAQLQKPSHSSPNTIGINLVRDSIDHINNHLNGQPSQVGYMTENPKSKFISTDFNSQNLLPRGTVRDTDSPPPPPPPSELLHDSIMNDFTNEKNPSNPDLEFPPPPPMVHASEENSSVAKTLSNLNLAQKMPLRTPESQPALSPFNSDSRGTLMASLQTDNPTARLRKTSVLNSSRQDAPPPNSNNMLAMLAQNLQIRRNAIDSIYLVEAEGDTDEDEWSA